MSKTKRRAVVVSAFVALCALGSVAGARAATAPMNERVSLERVSVTVDGVDVSSPKAEATLTAQSGGVVFSLSQSGAELEVYDVVR
ncbi:MAG: hypothetical protein JST00_24195 [Deltaproteobacteria bacterium]|nr:hypothetical protein [Deltaproteobacteria bacterium]